MKSIKSLWMVVLTIAVGVIFTSCSSDPDVVIEDMRIAEGSQLNIYVGQSGELHVVNSGHWVADYVPSYSWISSETSVVEIDYKTGKYNAKSEGSSIITVFNEYVNLSAQCEIRVKPIEISIAPSSKEMSIGEEFALTVEFTPKDAVDKDIVWYSTDPKVASITEQGKVTAIGVGECSIVAKTFAGQTAECLITVIPTDAEGIKLDITTITVIIGEEFTLTATITPEDTTDQTVTWYSSNNSIATVDDNGKVTAIKDGPCIISAKTHNNKQATCNVYVDPVNIEAISLDVSEKSIFIGEEFTLMATVTPENATYKNIKWESSNTAIAQVDNTGKVTAIKDGECIIYARPSKDTSSEVFAECKVTVLPIEVESITLDEVEKTLEVGQECTLIATIAPYNATYSDVIWYSSNTEIATVSDDGMVVAIAEGECFICAEASNKKVAKCKIIVKPIAVQRVQITSSIIKLMVGDTQKVEFSVYPTNAKVNDVKWSIEDPSIATVSNDGVVTCYGIGETKLTVIVNGEQRTECQIVGCDIEDFVYLKFGSAAVMDLNGYVQGSISCFIVNDSSKEIYAKSIQLIESNTGIAGNIMDAKNAAVAAHSNIGFTVTIKVAIYKPIFRWVYVYNGNEYTVEKMYETTLPW